VPADPALLERVLASSGVERTPVPAESSYLGELGRAAQQALMKALMKAGEALHLSPRVLWAAVAVFAALVFLLIARAVLSRLRRRAVGEETEAPTGAAPAASAVSWDAAGWRAELERRLAAGRTPDALEALWWWLARSLAGPEAAADWTSRDLVARSRRDDLRHLVRRLDAFTYGPRPPEIEDLRGLVGRLEAALA
jgi:Na+-transporting methylmalonyl-CoA/oxaloacetate decarboxylase gamma subunit